MSSLSSISGSGTATSTLAGLNTSGIQFSGLASGLDTNKLIPGPVGRRTGQDHHPHEQPASGRPEADRLQGARGPTPRPADQRRPPVPDVQQRDRHANGHVERPHPRLGLRVERRATRRLLVPRRYVGTGSPGRFARLHLLDECDHPGHAPGAGRVGRDLDDHDQRHEQHPPGVGRRHQRPDRATSRRRSSTTAAPLSPTTSSSRRRRAVPATPSRSRTAWRPTTAARPRLTSAP